MPGKFAANNLSQLLERLLPCLAFDILEAEENHGVLSLIGLIFLSLLPDRLVPEIDRGILVGLLKESTQHVHIQGLAKTPRAGKQCHLRPLIQELLDHQGLVHIVVFRRCYPIVRNANRERQLCFARRFLVGAGRGSGHPCTYLQHAALSSPIVPLHLLRGFYPA